jgi:hypothetical protein
MHPGRGADEEEHGASDGDGTATVTGSAANDGKVVEAALRLPAPLQRRDRERYAIVAEHGRGGLGRVLRAHDQELGRDVAIKELINRSHGAELRFFRESSPRASSTRISSRSTRPATGPTARRSTR